MKINRLSFPLLWTVFLFCIFNTCSADMFGSPLSLTEPGKVSVVLYGSKIYEKKITVIGGTNYANLGSQSASMDMTDNKYSISEEVGRLGVLYGLNDKVEIFARLVDGNAKGNSLLTNNLTNSSTERSSYTIGAKFIPAKMEKIKVGLIFQIVQNYYKFNVKYYPPGFFSNGTTFYQVNSQLPGKETINETNFLGLFGLGFSEPYFDTYLGVYLNKTIGDYKLISSGTANVTVVGSPGPGTTENVSLKYKTDIKAKSLFGGVIGARIKPSSNLFFDLEGHSTTERSINFAIGYTF